MCLPRRYFELNGDDLITIIDDMNENRCSVCGGEFRHTKRYVMVKETDDLKEVIFNTAHRGCLRIMGRIKAKRQEITDLEYKIYLKKMNPNSQT